MVYAIIAVIFILSAFWAIFVEPKMLKIVEYTLSDNDLEGLKVVFAGDLHIKSNQEKRLAEVVDKINSQKPDIILFAGDFSAGHKRKSTLAFEVYAKRLKRLYAKYGIYTVMGNHDYYAGYEDVKKMLESANISVLENSNKLLELENGKSICIAGVEDLQTKTPNVEKSLIGTNDNPTILLTHSPDIFVDVPKRNVKLTLAGHVHGGQIRLPFVGAIVIPSKFGNKYSQGLIEENGLRMLVTKGIGTSMLPIRFNCMPEIVVINF